MDSVFNKISEVKSISEIDEIKHTLFMENVKIQTEKNQLEVEYEELRRERKELINEKKKLKNEKKNLSIELTELREAVNYERKRLKDEEKLLEKKTKIIEQAYENFEKEKKAVDKERRTVLAEKDRLRNLFATKKKEVYPTGVFFRGVNNSNSLKKRYKDLLKIYHPDNMCGDNEILLKINEEYNELRSRLD